MFSPKLIKAHVQCRGTGAALAILLLAVLIAAAAVRVAMPAQMADSDKLDRVRVAARLDPANDAIRYRLARREMEAGELVAARQSLERAIQLNCWRPEYWADLARLCSATGDFACSDRAFERVVELAPMRPRYTWERAAYLAVTGQRERALAAFARYVQLSPNDAAAAFDTAERLYRDPNLVWTAIAKPAGSDAQIALLTWLAWRGQGEQTGLWWAQIGRGQLPAKAVRDYSEALVQHGNFALAQSVWSKVESIEPAPTSEAANGIYNPEFVLQPTNRGFDWHLAREWFVEPSIEEKDGRRALRVNYSVGYNADSEPAYQFVRVEPNESYLLSAEAESDDIASASGPRLRVLDAQCAPCLAVSSEQVVGTSEWKKLQLSFSTGPKTAFLRISLFRPRARAFPMDITGTIWLRNFRLAASGPPAAGQEGEQAE